MPAMLSQLITDEAKNKRKFHNQALNFRAKSRVKLEKHLNQTKQNTSNLRGSFIQSDTIKQESKNPRRSAGDFHLNQ
jgi:hypothetical protein